MHSGRKKGRREFLKGAATLAGAPWTATAVAAETGSTEGYGYESTDPYRFDSGPYLFTDWRYVAPGAINYLKSGGVEAPLKGTGQIEGITAVPAQVPFGIHLEAQRAEKIGPLIPNDKPWEHQLPHSSLHFLDGKYRLWYWAKTPQGSDTGGVLCYAESSDVLNWVKPSLGLVEFAGSKENNIVFRGGGCTVFLDPSAPSAERLKMIYMSREESPGSIGRLKQKSPGSVSPRGEQLKLELRMAVSPDGFHWKRLDEPVMSHMSDTQNTVYYDTILQRYVGYFRMLFQDRRAIGRAETADYRRWPVPHSCSGRRRRTRPRTITTPTARRSTPERKPLT